jgi:WhiB family redox-sensing transcriptional regulator
LPKLVSCETISIGKVRLEKHFKRKPKKHFGENSTLPQVSRNLAVLITTEGLRMDMQWLNESRCLTEDPELFFPVGNTGPAAEQIEQAKAVCRECTVSSQCLEYAIKENQDSGVWGGLSEDERKSLKRKYARARRAG